MRGGDHKRSASAQLAQLCSIFRFSNNHTGVIQILEERRKEGRHGRLEGSEGRKEVKKVGGGRKEGRK